MQEHHSHEPVLLDKVVEALDVRPGGIYLDGTFGRGGHSAGILARLGPEGHLLATDKDPAALAIGRERFGDDPRVEILHGSFLTLVQELERRGWMGRVDGILLDLGVSSPQLDDSRRGFSFRQDGPLDMRMNPEQGPSAADWLAVAEEGEIARVLKEYGEERYARRIARAIVGARSETPIRTTAELARIVAAASPTRERHKDPATRTFQAVRIYINRELDELDEFLVRVPDMLAPGGRLAVISFHSLEDRRVKRFIRDQARGPRLPPELPVVPEQFAPRLKAVGKAQRADEVEVRQNPRSRSAVLRVAERLP